MNTRSTTRDELLSLDHNLEATLRRNKKKQQGLFETDLGGESSFIHATPPPSPPPSPPPQPPVMAEQTLRQSAVITAIAIAPLCIVYSEPAEGKDRDFELKSNLAA